MNCFPLIKIVLDEIYAEIPNLDDLKKDQAIYQRVLYLFDQYRGLLTSQDSIDYHDPITRFAYLYKYVPFHANIIYNVINRSTDLQKVFDKERVKVTCIGGGPGSDLLGILKYIAEVGKNPQLNFILYDREEAWGESWEDLDNKLNLNLRIFTNFQRFDVLDRQTWSQKSKYLNSDLFTMMYFMSEVYKFKDQAGPYFDHLFSKIPSGAYLLFVDNDSKEFFNWFDELAEKNNICPLKQLRTSMKLEDDDENKGDLGIYYKKFGNADRSRPKLTAQVAYRISRKIEI